ncbi:hypothetical protein BGZ72_003016 [Mortierella alpina]|nr:hypothetical protein BGZ72_003016 [Mortierella alpina]
MVAMHADEHDKGRDYGHSEGDHSLVVNELQRELRLAILEIEKVSKTSRDLAHMNQELEESRLLAVSDQARTAKRLVLMSSQLEFTEQKLFSLTQEVGDGQKDSDLLRIERIKREALQEREDAGRLRIETLQDELQEIQRSERLLQQKLLTTQSKYETLAKRHDLLRRQQQEVDLARESREAIAWLKETTDRLCSPPQGSLGQAIQQEKTLQGVAPINIHQSSPSTSPPSSVIADPPLAAQNQLISLIKELATANSTLRTELTEYRDLLQDSRNEIITLRSQVEDYEQGHVLECCGGNFLDDPAGDPTMAPGAWNAYDGQETLDVGLQMRKEHLQATGSPPPYMTTPAAHAEQHLHHHFHLPGVRGNVFDELEQRLYQQGNPLTAAPSSRHKSRHSSRKDAGGHRTSKDHTRSTHSRHAHHAHHVPAALRTTATVSTSTSTSEVRRPLVPSTASGPYAHLTARAKTRLRAESDPHVTRSRHKKSLYTDADLDLLGSGDEQEDYKKKEKSKKDDAEDHEELLSDDGDSDGDQEPGFVAAFAEALSFLSFFSGPLSGSPP